MFEKLFADAFIFTGVMSFIPLACAITGSLVVSIIQAATQIQEQSIGYIVKLCIIAALIISLGGYASAQAVEFTQKTFLALGAVSP